jgi:anti-sigma B factor antagonist
MVKPMTATSAVLEDIQGVIVIRVLDRKLSHDTGESIAVLIPPWLHDHEPLKFVLDLSKITFICSIGLTVLVVLLKRIKVAGGRLVIAGLTDQCRKVMSVTGLDRAFEFYDTVDEAIAALQAGAYSVGSSA